MIPNSTEFLQIKADSNPDNLDFTSLNIESYNASLTLRELQQTIQTMKIGVIGEDKVHLQMLISMPENTLLLVLNLFNDLWQAGLFPTCWKTAIIIPLLKEGKNPNLVDSYRPISLLSVIGKLFEKIISIRFTWQLETLNLFSKV